MGSIERMVPPVAKKVKHEMEMFGDFRNDNYYWLRDDSRSNPQVLSYLHQENAYTDFIMSGILLKSLCICVLLIFVSMCIMTNCPM